MDTEGKTEEAYEQITKENGCTICKKKKKKIDCNCYAICKIGGDNNVCIKIFPWKENVDMSL